MEYAKHYHRLRTPDGFPRHQRPFRLLQILGTVALILVIIGITDETSSSSSSNSQGNTMRRVGVILFTVLYVMLVGICLYLWTQIRFVMRYRKQVSFSKYCHLFDQCSYALSSALEGHLHRTSIPGHSDALQHPVHVLFELVFTNLNLNDLQHWRPGKVQPLHGRMANLPRDGDAHGVCYCDHLFCCSPRVAPQRRLQVFGFGSRRVSLG